MKYLHFQKNPFRILCILPVFIFSSFTFSAQIDTVEIKSKAMQKSSEAVIVLPEKYLSGYINFPVLYLLHGWSGCYRDWSRHTDIGILADKYGIIIVCPDGGYAGWYIDSPLVEDSQYETYISDEVVAFVDEHYRTIAEKDGRVICGLSMGGHGAISMLARHPDIYCAAGSMSGVMELTSSSKKYGLTELLGDYKINKDNWEKNSCINLASRLAEKNKGIIIDCGVDDFLVKGNRKMHKKLLKLKIDHDYYERPGKHGWNYWTNALEYHILFFSKFLKHE